MGNIENDQQLGITRKWIQTFLEYLEELKQQHVEASDLYAHQLSMQSIESQVESLKQEIEDYLKEQDNV